MTSVGLSSGVWRSGKWQVGGPSSIYGQGMNGIMVYCGVSKLLPTFGTMYPSSNASGVAGGGGHGPNPRTVGG